jgi:hypothetical protein
MWKVKTFKTAKAFQSWVVKNDKRMQWHEIFVNNRYGVEYRPLRIIG